MMAGISGTGQHGESSPADPAVHVVGNGGEAPELDIPDLNF